MFPLLLLSAIGGYTYAKNKYDDNPTVIKTSNDNQETSKARVYNTYNYYTNESENGNTLFGSQKKTKRTLFGGENFESNYSY